MKIAVVCGGTGGQVLPGCVTARALAARAHDVTLWLGGRDVESMSAGGWTGRIVRVRAAGFDTGFSLRAVSTTARLLAAGAVSYRRMRGDPPDVVLAMGGYASVGPVLSARRLGVPIVLHEANAVPGRAIAFLSRFATRVAIAFESARSHFPKVPVTFTGFPVREGLADAGRIEGLDPSCFTILVMGGSQGAHALNEIVPRALVQLRRQGASFQVIHLAGMKDQAGVITVYENAGIVHRVYGFTEDIGKAYGSASVAISRAGAGSCSELAVCRVPALLVPLPGARRDHQLANAREIEGTGGADLVLQKDLTEAWLVKYMEAVITNPSRLEKMRTALRGFDILKAGEKLADVIEETAH